MNLDYQGTYWDAQDLRTLKDLIATGQSWDTIATTLKRTPEACKLRWSMIRTGMMYFNGRANDTLRTFSKRNFE